MTLPTDSKAPAEVSGSSLWTIGGVGEFIRAIKRISDWISGLSPASATVHDTGPVTTGLAITASTNWTIQAYALRRRGNHVRGAVVAAYSGSTITPPANGNITDLPCFTLPVGWRNTQGYPQEITPFQSGVKSAFGRIDSGSGLVVITHGIPAVTIDSANHWYFPIDVWCD